MYQVMANIKAVETRLVLKSSVDQIQQAPDLKFCRTTAGKLEEDVLRAEVGIQNRKTLASQRQSLTEKETSS